MKNYCCYGMYADVGHDENCPARLEMKAAAKEHAELVKRAIDSVRLFDRLSFKERLRMAIAHAETHGQMNDALWPHQRFAMTLGELLRAAENQHA